MNGRQGEKEVYLFHVFVRFDASIWKVYIQLEDRRMREERGRIGGEGGGVEIALS